MKEWTREERYRVLHSADEVRDLYDQIKDSRYRQAYHVQPVTGLSSDPNGFGYHKGIWDLYFQWCPWGAVHGLKYWYHVSSKDLIHWENEGVGLAPDTYYDNKGTHSGSAFSEGDDLYLFYTGNHRDEDWTRTPYTCAAKVGEDRKPVKLDKPLFGPRPDYSEHQRDPKIVYVPSKKKYYIFIGAQNLDLKGRALIYESESLLEGWSFAGELKVPGFEDFGGMWECPCIVNISGKDVLIFSPQYTTLPGRGNSTNHNVYIVGSMDYDTLTFTPEADYQYLDFGFDFYAAQFAANVGDPDKAILIAWIGLPDNHYPTEEEDWEGSMCLPRELRLKNGKLVQSPVEGFAQLRGEEIPAEGKLPAVAEVELTFAGGDADVALFTKADGSGGLTIHYDEAGQVVTVDRTGMNKRFNTNVFEVLDMPLTSPLKKMSVYIDRSSVEIFANDGEETFTTHLYPEQDEFGYQAGDNVAVRIWPLQASNSNEFVV
ncbi:MAG: sucrose-6-phosphate hydrolase [Lachnospiraceae bacterium]|jgi:beta-fructofuranosidase|nr:sucrose-6-phosphate hydrolase [Lachnospiraceae bacterium]